MDAVELRAHVGGTLTVIAFQDGQIVRRGDPLFVIDPRPFQIKRDQAVAQLQSAEARQALTKSGREVAEIDPVSLRDLRP